MIPQRAPAALALVLALAPLSTLPAQEPDGPLTLEEAVARAVENSQALQAARLRVEETANRTESAFANYLPTLETSATYTANNNTQGILIPQGSFGNLPQLGGDFPPADLNIAQGGNQLFFTLTTVTQPLTHFFKIRHGHGVAGADEAAARAGLEAARQEVALGVMQAYAGLYLARREREIAEVEVRAAAAKVGYREAAVTAGNALDVAAREAKVAWLEARQAELSAQSEVEDLAFTLADLMGVPPETDLELRAPQLGEPRVAPVDEYVRRAQASNAEVLQAGALVTKAQHGVGAARADYIPEIGIVGMHSYQSSVPFLPKNTFGVALRGSWTVFDFGKRGDLVGERRAQLGQAERNLSMTRTRVRGEVEAAYRKVERARLQLELAREALALRTEASRLQALQASTGYALPAQELEATALRLEAEKDAAAAEFGFLLALAELEKAAGRLETVPGS